MDRYQLLSGTDRISIVWASQKFVNVNVEMLYKCSYCWKENTFSYSTLTKTWKDFYTFIWVLFSTENNKTTRHEILLHEQGFLFHLSCKQYAALTSASAVLQAVYSTDLGICHQWSRSCCYGTFIQFALNQLVSMLLVSSATCTIQPWGRSVCAEPTMWYTTSVSPSR